MRRNSENLLVLGGHEDPRKWTQPVPLLDVVRAAISEIEQYERIAVNIQPGVLITGRAASDVVHLAAELIENATAFSSAHVLVTAGMLTSGGALIEITDEGLGIEDQDLAHANWRLDHPPVIDVGVSRRMGLFVVGRLAARHGIRVRLKHAHPRGLSALVWLPDSLAQLEAMPASSPRRPADTGAYLAAAPVPPDPAAFTMIPAPTSLPSSGDLAHVAAAHPAGPGWFRRGGVPSGNLLHGSRDRADSQHGERQGRSAEISQQAAIAHRRSPGEVRSRLSEFQHGARRGRSDAPRNSGTDEKTTAQRREESA
jgi:hypothetical protein